MSLIFDYIGNMILSIVEVYAWHNIFQKEIKLDNKSLYLKIFLLATGTFIISIVLNDFINAIGIMVLSTIFCKLIIKCSIKESIILSFIGELLIVIAESLFVAILTLILNIDMQEVTHYVYLANIFVAIFVLLISKQKIISKIFYYIDRITINVKIYQLIIFLFFTIFGIAFCFASTYFENNLQLMILINLFISLFYSIIVVFIFKYQYKYYSINNKYNMSLEDLYVQEQLINDYRIMNHENKNNLNTIYSMTDDYEIKRYINSLLKRKNELKMNIINDSLKLPSKGIRGLIYNKMIIMKDNNIKYGLNVDKRINTKLFEQISDDNIVDLCQILGVFIDNAIESSTTIDNNVISMNFYLIDKKFVIKISNNCESDQIVYNEKKIKTTKGKNRGYGLKLVKRIVENNDKISNKTIINKNCFVQKIEFKI